MAKMLKIVEAVLLVLGVVSLIPMLINTNSVDAMLFCAYAYCGVALISTIVLSVWNLCKSSNKSKLGFIVFGGCILMLVCTYAFGNTTPVAGSDGTIYDSILDLKVSDMILYSSYIGFALAIVLLIAGEIKNSFK